MRHSAFALLLTIVAVIACSGPAQPGADVLPATPLPTEAAAPSPAPEPPFKPLFKDEFFEDASDALDFHRLGISSGGDMFAGAAWLDYDNDGWLDLYLTNTKGADNALFRNNGDGTFTDVARQTGVANGDGSGSATAADINNDGCADLFVNGTGGVQQTAMSGPKLYVNNCDGTFNEVIAASGIQGIEAPMGAAFGDINNDGLLDLYVVTRLNVRSSSRATTAGATLDHLYLNRGDRTFRNISRDAGLTHTSAGCSVAFVDYNDDQLQDLLVGSCSFGAAIFELYRNNGDMTFTDVATEAGINVVVPPSTSPELSMRTNMGFADYNGDGYEDLFSTGWGRPPVGPYGDMFKNSLFRKASSGSFVEISQAAGIRDTQYSARSWGAAFQDLNNDGHADIFLVSGLAIEDVQVQTGSGYLIKGNGDGRFEVAATYDFSGPGVNGLAAADYDNDGYVDIVVGSSEAYLKGGRPVLMHNTGSGKSWVTVKAVGMSSNKSGVGAAVTVRGGGKAWAGTVRAGGAFHSSHSPWLTFGLGDIETVDIEVRWPSGLAEVFEGLAARRTVELVEGTGKAQ
ncbi:MAG: CRTAC1 family protein [SAR202 cluster bacterium]|nr:CRTAC1 family protein [SAR202 cluster bacterium]